MKKGDIIGLTQTITFKGRKRNRRLRAKVDTGADKSSIDTKLASQIDLGPAIRTRKVSSAHGITIRPIVRADIKINRKELNADFTVADRTHMKYKVLIGKNILRRLRVLIDPNKK